MLISVRQAPRVPDLRPNWLDRWVPWPASPRHRLSLRIRPPRVRPHHRRHHWSPQRLTSVNHVRSRPSRPVWSGQKAGLDQPQAISGSFVLIDFGWRFTHSVGIHRRSLGIGIVPPSFSNICKQKDPFLTGALHCLLATTDGFFESIFCFDCVIESFRFGNDHKYPIAQMRFSVLCNCPCIGLYLYSEPEPRSDVWMMADYDVKGSWAKVITITEGIDIDILYHPLRPLNNEEIFMSVQVPKGAIALKAGTTTGYISPWIGEFYSVLDPTYVKDYIRIMASIFKHQPTTGIGKHNLRVSIASSSSNSPTHSSSPENKSPFSPSYSMSSPMMSKFIYVPTNSVSEKKEYPTDPSLPNIKNSIYSMDEEKMLTKETYGSTIIVGCLALILGRVLEDKGICLNMLMGCFECWLHPAQYDTRLCKDGTSCARRDCFLHIRLRSFGHCTSLPGLLFHLPRSTAAASAIDMSAAFSLLPGSPSAVMSHAFNQPCSGPDHGNCRIYSAQLSQ
ncbi:hypothetical protein F0562_001070 [Nyssa sinensis]|uniref:F-box associated domain-containing protein n=1 Tax=Nyssa sinensis TaxID=561372 RepID=A0A5J5C345_9ASTE|nr:hypothetical protein F0562_001070 [Nyssa sinensis]